MKKVLISAKPSKSVRPPSAEEWVQQKPTTEAEPIKRLTIDIPKSLHMRVKSQCVLRGVNMVDVVRDFLEREFKEEYRQATASPNTALPSKNRTPRGP